MGYLVDKFTFDETGVEMDIQLTDGSVVDEILGVKFIFPNEVEKQYIKDGVNELVITDLGSDKWQFRYDDTGLPQVGIYIGEVNFDGSGPQAGISQFTIMDYQDVVQCLITKVLREEYDCILLQQIEVIRQGIFANDVDLVKAIYDDAQAKCAFCTEGGYTEELNGTKITIEDGTYIIT